MDNCAPLKLPTMPVKLNVPTGIVAPEKAAVLLVKWLIEPVASVMLFVPL